MLGDVNGAVCTITTPDDTQGDVRSTVYINVWSGGILVCAMVDTGAQLIISRPMLDEIGQHLVQQGDPIPVLE